MGKFTGVSGLIDVCFLALSLGVILQTQWLIKDPRGSRDRQEEEIRLIFNAVLTVGVLWWPLVWDATIGLDKLIEQPRLLPGFLWVPVLTMMELQYVSKFSAATGKAGRASALFQHSDLNADTSSIISAAFAMGSLFFSSTKNYTATHIIMYALVFCLAFVVPTLQVPPETKEAVMWRSVQHLILNYSIGFIISGISTDLLKKLFNKEDGAEGAQKVEEVYPDMPKSDNLHRQFDHTIPSMQPAHNMQGSVTMLSSSSMTGGGLTFTDLPQLRGRLPVLTGRKNMWRTGQRQ